MKYKTITFVFILFVIVAAIAYLELARVHPAVKPGVGAQTIEISGAASSTPSVSTSGTLTLQALAAADKKAGYEPAIEIMDPTGFVNASSSFKLADLIGKQVVLLDF